MKRFVLFLALILCSNLLFAQSPWRFEEAVRNYACQAIDNPPIPGCTLFVGSSSFAIWGKKLEETFVDYEAVNRGFGGSKFPDNLQAIERIHLPAHPSRVVIFCGTNDVAGGADADTVFKNFKYYIAKIWNENPTAEVYFVSLSHAPSREKFWPTGDELCDKVKEFSKKFKGLFFIDIITPMNGENGRVREDLFVKDRLHLNDEGYAIWTKAFKEAFDAQDKARQKPDLKELYETRKAAGVFDDPRFAEEKIAIRDYSKPMKKLVLVFLGDSITAGAGISEKSDAPPSRCGAYLKENGYGDLTVANCGVSGYTTLDFLPKIVDGKPTGKQFLKVLDAAEPFKNDKDTELIFSIMLGTNDSAVKGPNGSPVSPEDYRRNMKEIADKLLDDFPTAKIVIHRPIWYSPTTQNSSTYLLEGQLRLRAYWPELETLVGYYEKTSVKGCVFLGDVNAFNYFKTNAERVFLPEKGAAGDFFLHPNKPGADVLGRFWGAAVKRAIEP